MLDAMPAGAGCLTAIRLRCSRMTPSPGKADAGYRVYSRQQNSAHAQAATTVL